MIKVHIYRDGRLAITGFYSDAEMARKAVNRLRAEWPDAVIKVSGIKKARPN